MPLHHLGGRCLAHRRVAAADHTERGTRRMTAIGVWRPPPPGRVRRVRRESSDRGRPWRRACSALGVHMRSPMSAGLEFMRVRRSLPFTHVRRCSQALGSNLGSVMRTHFGGEVQSLACLPRTIALAKTPHSLSTLSPYDRCWRWPAADCPNRGQMWRPRCAIPSIAGSSGRPEFF
jgi:hypothetical protein